MNVPMMQLSKEPLDFYHNFNIIKLSYSKQENSDASHYNCCGHFCVPVGRLRL